jgi:hypothetical protein
MKQSINCSFFLHCKRAKDHDDAVAVVGGGGGVDSGCMEPQAAWG